MARLLNPTSFKGILEGKFNHLLRYIRNDNTLDLQIRDNYLNIYYLGGNILKVCPSKDSYDLHFDYKYLKAAPFIEQDILHNYLNKMDWYNYIPLAKQAMDFYFSKHPKEEREFQQLVVRENNYSSVANSTDYFIIDIEYDNRANARFDLVALQWPSESSARKLLKDFKPKLSIIEMKYGDGALTGTAGMLKHWQDFNSLISDSEKLKTFKSEMLDLFQQKRQLGLIPCLSQLKNNNQVVEFAEDVDLIFLIANHDPASTKLTNELTKLKDQSIKFCSSNFMGYGLYQQNIFTLEEFNSRFKEQI